MNFENDSPNYKQNTDRRSRITNPQSYLGNGKLQPQALDLEEAVLGALMLEKDALSSVIDVLKPEVFYEVKHQKIFDAIRILFEKTSPVDILTVTAQLRQQGELEMIGGAYYITELTNRVASAANIEYHSRIIIQKFIQRELIRISTDVINSAYEDTSDVLEMLDKAEKNLFEIAQNNLRRDSRKMDDLVHEALKDIEALKDKKDGLTGVASGFTDLDRMTSGWQKSDLVIIAARPAMGKTAFVLSCARNAAVDFDKPVVVFSLEMSSVQLVNRLISGETEIEQEKIRKGTLEEWEWQQIHSKIGRLEAAPLIIDDTPSLNIFEFRAKCRRLKSQHDIQLIIIDYLQLMQGKADGKGGGNREQEIGSISRALKTVAKELNVPVIALSQLSRAVENRPGGSKRPMLSDLRESGSIEQDADMVLFLYRPEYYGLDVDEDNNPTQGVGEVIIAKHRNGETGRVRLKFVGKYVKFQDLDQGMDSFGAPGAANAFAGLSPSQDFDSKPSNFIIRPSRMDDIDDEPPF
ncbi:replicative DNA helicase [Mucilaginibacter phyllosphaerae]|uniref:Replicative DNA helicase n=1 Tax=Mucilaginibacter phyllosphaerae TaxID=1812349 RepID=A0A4Y8A8S4_9SPHI|nr:replicative DNA helicase [Mucilaginibacter phyllosphaerae]MBB3970806.1 replicative DNA helicase [Mucilaginibacter phyllosphaerae]TEW64254.1 replicative DNA helicase [Mucilaginibacter phyllosphaerae]GGH04720.1 replicative DNA helicase [Mucilaginibacter phyllosphaerae]